MVYIWFLEYTWDMVILMVVMTMWYKYCMVIVVFNIVWLLLYVISHTEVYWVFQIKGVCSSYNKLTYKIAGMYVSQLMSWDKLCIVDPSNNLISKYKRIIYFVCKLPIQVRNNNPNCPDRCKLYDKRTPFIWNTLYTWCLEYICDISTILMDVRPYCFPCLDLPKQELGRAVKNDRTCHYI